MELWEDLKKNKPLLITVLAAIGVFLYIIYKNGAGNAQTAIATPTTTMGTYVEGIIPIPGSPGPQGPPGPKGDPFGPPVPGRRPPQSGVLAKTGGHAGALESSPHVPIFKNGKEVFVPVGQTVTLTGRSWNYLGKFYYQVKWHGLTGWLGSDVLEGWNP